MAKKIQAVVKLQCPAGAATPAPPVGTALGPHGVNIMEFVKQFNARTQRQSGMVIPVVVTIFADRTFTFITKTPPAPNLLLKEAGIEKGSGQPNRIKVGRVTRANRAASRISVEGSGGGRAATGAACKDSPRMTAEMRPSSVTSTLPVSESASTASSDSTATSTSKSSLEHSARPGNAGEDGSGEGGGSRAPQRLEQLLSPRTASRSSRRRRAARAPRRPRARP